MAKRNDYEFITLANGTRRSIIDLLQEHGPDYAIAVKGGGGRKIPLGNIPLVVFTLKCGYSNKGMAVQKGDLIMCPEHNVEEPVALVSGE